MAQCKCSVLYTQNSQCFRGYLSKPVYIVRFFFLNICWGREREKWQNVCVCISIYPKWNILWFQEYLESIALLLQIPIHFATLLWKFKPLQLRIRIASLKSLHNSVVWQREKFLFYSNFSTEEQYSCLT